MDFNSTIDIIIKDLREAREIIDDLKNYPGVPQLQVEIAKSKCKSAEEVIALLKTLKEERRIPVQEKKIIEHVVKEPVMKAAENFIETGAEDSIEEIANQPVDGSDSKLQSQPEQKKRETAIIADRFTDMPDTLHESLGKINKEDDISSVIKSKPVVSLSEAIGINDKFLFIREVFGGSQTNYDEAITKLNKVDNFSDAKAIIMSYTGDGDENDAAVQLLNLVKRKLASDG